MKISPWAELLPGTCTSVLIDPVISNSSCMDPASMINLLECWRHNHITFNAATSYTSAESNTFALCPNSEETESSNGSPPNLDKGMFEVPNSQRGLMAGPRGIATTSAEMTTDRLDSYMINRNSKEDDRRVFGDCNIIKRRRTRTNFTG